MVSISYKNILIATPNQRTANRVKKVLNFLELRDRAEFVRTTSLFKKITITPTLKNYNETDVKEREWITSPEIFVEADIDIPYVASLIIHETHHLAQHKAGRKYFGKKAELLAMRRQQNFLRKIGYDSAIEWLEDQFKKGWWKTMDDKKKHY